MKLSELIKQNDLAISEIEELKSTFLNIEDEYKQIISDYNNKESEIKNHYNQLIKDKETETQQQYEKELQSFERMEYVQEELELEVVAVKKSIILVNVLKWVIIFIGLILLFYGKWLWGFGLIIFSFWQLGTFKIKETVAKMESFIKNKNFDLHINEILKLSSSLKNSIISRKEYEEEKLKNLSEALNKEFNEFETKKNEERAKKISELRSEKEKSLNKFKIDADNKVQLIKKRIIEITDVLNKLPESFDSEKYNWNDDHIFKGKELVAPNFRTHKTSLSIRYVETSKTLVIPGLFPFLNKNNLALYCKNDYDLEVATQISHNIISRFLLSLPANKIKLTIFDPLNLGANAAPFTPLTREINGGRIYTQSEDIKEQLNILSRAIENIIQRYLQDNFNNIAEYNKKTEEVLEPYRLLVIYNFPYGFDSETIKKLINIMKSGPKAGVHTLMINNKKFSLPYDMDWEIFKEAKVVKIPFELDIDKPLPHKEIVEYINNQYHKTSSVKIPFINNILPKEKWWKEKTSKSISIPIGKHALEIQNLTYNNDDDNQALLIGKPGSGKSNLLHIIIANTILKYSPDEVEIYLIDFKGGVEFNIYADKKIPHIKTLAIESEREFGLSVLEGVEKELLRREMEFSKVGVQNIEQYKQKFPDKKMPRVLLIVDEFQEFFTEDDSIRQEVDEKYDRIVRKGRAFGINTLFSSQTLAGNSINKSTKDLIDIRIALMCSETDAYEIFDEKNPAAKDLSNPGEGIYNAEGGKIEGNRFFQAFFAEKSNFDKVISDVAEYSKTNYDDYNKFKQIVFRGSKKAYIEPENHPIKKVTPVFSPSTIKLWLGEPVSIRNDINAILRKESGYNFIVTGHDESTSFKIMYSSLLSILSQHTPKSTTFYVFNFISQESELHDQVDNLLKHSHQNYFIVKRREILDQLKKIQDEIRKRIDNNEQNGENIFLSFFAFQRGRSFRKDGYSMSEEGQILEYILKEGPDVGVFTLLQVNSIDGFEKNLDSSILKEFSQRATAQINPDNSIKLLGNQKAAKLKSNRAYYFDDNENILLKFKPYELYPVDKMDLLINKQPKLI